MHGNGQAADKRTLSQTRQHYIIIRQDRSSKRNKKKDLPLNFLQPFTLSYNQIGPNQSYHKGDPSRSASIKSLNNRIKHEQTKTHVRPQIHYNRV